MKIYFVTRWGNDVDGQNEADTNFIVFAPNYDLAAMFVDEMLAKVDDSKASKFCQRITELGTSHTDLNVPKLLSGPFIEHALYHDSVGIPDEKKWVRDNIEEGWVDFSEYY